MDSPSEAILRSSNAEKIEEYEKNIRTASDADPFTDSERTLSGQPLPVMPVERNADRYNMSHLERGKAVIFNHKNFSNGQRTRHGTEKDATDLAELLQALRFQVIVYEDLTKIKILTKIEELGGEDHSNRDCILIIVLSHGDQDKVFSKDGFYRPDDLWTPFTANKCSSLAGKPKMFFLQACRGGLSDSGTTLYGSDTDSLAFAGQERNNYTVPNLADFLLVFSTAPGYLSYRDCKSGSWFIQTLIKVLEKHKDDMDLLSMLTIVTREVALNYPPQDEPEKKQVPMINSTLTRNVYFMNNTRRT